MAKHEIERTQELRAKAATMKFKLTQAYQIIDSMTPPPEGLSDTAFTDKLHAAKANIASAICDFLMSDSYWEDRIEALRRSVVYIPS